MKLLLFLLSLQHREPAVQILIPPRAFHCKFVITGLPDGDICQTYSGKPIPLTADDRTELSLMRFEDVRP